MASFGVYTALYDLERDKIDSRKFEEYVVWLRDTVALFPNITVFHGGELDGLEISNCNLIKKHLSDLHTFEYHSQVEALIVNFSAKSPQDITFKLSTYALLQFAKFELASEISNDFESVVWVDAGISRFVSKINYPVLEKSIRKEMLNGTDYIFELDVKNNFYLKSFAIKDAEVGSCRRIISGGSFLVRSSHLPIIQRHIFDGIETWINQGIWDNEQVMLRKIIHSIPGKILFIPQISGIPGCLPRSFSARKIKLYLLLKKSFMNSLLRGRGLY